LRLKEFKKKEDISDLQLKRVIDDFINCYKEMKELTRKMEHNEKTLSEYFDKSGVKEIETSYGVLCRDEDTGHFTLKF